MTGKNTLFVLTIFLTSCSVLSTPLPTQTLTQTTTVVVLPTSTYTPTRPPTRTPIPPFSGGIGELAVLDGFTISVPFPLLHQVNKNVILVGDTDKVFTISYTSDSYDNIGLENVVDGYLSSLESKGFQFSKADTVPVKVDGADGLTIGLTATAGGMNFEGESMVVSPGSGLVIFGLGLAKTDDAQDAWKNYGSPAFDALIKSIKFTDFSSGCIITTDKTYGYDKDNPIQVGGDDFQGPSRERAYLDNLLGPNGEPLSYTREGSLDNGDVILDRYHLTGKGVNAELYIDEYNFLELYAPVGFTCTSAFPLTTP